MSSVSTALNVHCNPKLWDPSRHLGGGTHHGLWGDRRLCVYIYMGRAVIVRDSTYVLYTFYFSYSCNISEHPYKEFVHLVSPDAAPV